MGAIKPHTPFKWSSCSPSTSFPAAVAFAVAFAAFGFIINL